jgi:hypothetical protein
LLGIPTVTDRVIQQAIAQVLTPMFDPTFSESSFGFRPGRNAHQAIQQVQACVKAGRRIAVDIDLAKFFDTVNHDVLMSLLGRTIRDKRLLALIGRYLRAGVLVGEHIEPGEVGTPQGGPLSLLLANILLHQLDRELEPLCALRRRHGHSCQERTRRTAGHAQHHAVPGTRPQAQGQPGQKQGCTDERMQLAWASPSRARRYAGLTRSRRTSSTECVNSRGAAGACQWSTGCTSWGNTCGAGRRTSASASTTVRCPSWMTGSGGESACATGNSGAGCARRSSTC